MMKKRLVAFGLAGVMLMGMSMNVAAETTPVTGAEGSASVEYTQPESYIVNIPSVITISDIKTSTEIKGFTTPEINIKKGNKVAISVKKATFEVTGEAGGWNKDLTMAVYDNKDSEISAGAEVISYSLKDDDQTIIEESQGLKVKLKDSSSAGKILADKYSGTVDFDISIVNK